MSAVIPRCERCDRECVFVRIAPIGNQSSYGAEWRCGGCDHHVLEICPLGPLTPTESACLNCGTEFADLGDAAECPHCGMTRRAVVEFFGLDPAPADPVDAASKLFDQGLIRQGLAMLNHALLFDPSLERAWQTKYAFLSGLGFLDGAIEVIEAAIEHTVDPELIISYGHLLQTAGRHREAIDVYREYLATAPKGEFAGVALCNMANATVELNDPVGAEVLYRRAIDAEPARATHYASYVRLLLNEKRFDAALPLIETGLACAAEPAMAARLLEDRALVYAEKNQGTAALESVDAAFAHGASGIRAIYLRGRALALLGQLDEARECIQRVLKMDPDNADALRAKKLIDKAMR